MFAASIVAQTNLNLLFRVIADAYFVTNSRMIFFRFLSTPKIIAHPQELSRTSMSFLVLKKSLSENIGFPVKSVPDGRTHYVFL